MTDDDMDEAARHARLLVTIAVLAVVAAAVILVVDFRLKREVMGEAEKFRQEVRGGRQQGRQSGRAARDDGVSSAVSRPDRVADVGADPGAPAEPDTHEPAPIVRPGDDSARPPHRGSLYR
jgi:hypothetical protein